MKYPKDLTGLVFDKLTVIRRDELKPGYWLCQCDCKNPVLKSIERGNIIFGGVRSCGCLMKTGGNLSHGLTGTKCYKAWEQIKMRCYSENNPRYKTYGGRGIKLYEPWIKDPLAFVTYIKSLDNAEKDGYSIDRINNDGNYEPGNLKWSTDKEQGRNMTTTVINIETANKIKELLKEHKPSEVAKILNIKRHIVNNILYRQSWCDE